MADGIFVDANGLRELGADLVRAAEGFDLALPGVVGKSAKELATEARKIAREYPKSSSSPSKGRAREVARSVQARPRTKRAWVVEATDILAGLWELGNKGSGEHDETFRHPTFGNDPWVDQKKWRFFTMAMERYEPVYYRTITSYVEAILSRFRL